MFVFSGVGVWCAEFAGEVVVFVSGASLVLSRREWGIHKWWGHWSTVCWVGLLGFVGRWKVELVVVCFVLVVVVCPWVCSSGVCICSRSRVVFCCGVSSGNTSMCCLVGSWSGTLCEWVWEGEFWTAEAG